MDAQGKTKLSASYHRWLGALCLIAAVAILCVTTLRMEDMWTMKPLMIVRNTTAAPVTGDWFPDSPLENDNVCMRILYGADGNFTDSRFPDKTTDEEVMRFMQSNDCETFKQKFRFSLNEDDNYISDAEKNYPVAYGVLAHNKAKQLAHLLSSIYAPQNLYCVHVDLKSSEAFKSAVRAITQCLPNVFLSSRSEEVVYASFSRLQADINCMDDLLSSDVPWKHLINLCGQDFPLFTNYEIVAQLLALKGRNVIGGYRPDADALKRTEFVYRIVNTTGTNGQLQRVLVRTDVRKAPPPGNFTVYKNNAYNIYSRQFLQWAIRDSEKAKELLEWSKDTLTPDEHYWRTLETVDEAPDKGVRRDAWQIARYIKWRHPGLRCSGFWRNFNCVFGVGDVSGLKGTSLLFANKFDMTFDARPVVCLRKWLDQRKKRYDKRNPNKQFQVP